MKKLFTGEEKGLMDAVEARREYCRAYRQKNAERINKNLSAWRKANPDKVRAAENRYWERRAARLQAEREAGESSGGINEN